MFRIYDIMRMTPDESAHAAAGNWREWESFAWHAEPDDGERWFIWNLETRDSDELEQSNASAIRNKLTHEDYAADVAEEHFSHWAYGWGEAIAIRCYDDDGRATPAWIVAHGLMEWLADYPVLDEEDWSRREYESGIEWATDEGPRVFGRAWGVFVEAGDVMQSVLDCGAPVNGDNWAGVWDWTAERMGVQIERYC